jgi:hypothetical protein
MKMILTRDQILGSKDATFEDVLVPEWAPEVGPDGVPLTAEQKQECYVRIRNLTGNGRALFLERSMDLAVDSAGAPLAKQKVDFEMEIMLVAMTAIDENGKPQFTIEDLKILGEKSADPITRCSAVASRISGITKKASDDAGKPSTPVQS